MLAKYDIIISMNKSAKHFDAYVVISTFGRALMEAFIPVIMLKSGYDLHGILFYYMLMNLISFMITYPLAMVSKRFDNRILATIAILAYIGMQFALPYMNGSIEIIVTIALLYALYRRCYWQSRRFYMLHIVRDKSKIGKSYAIISILNQLALMGATYVGAMCLDGLSMNILIIVSGAIMFLGLIPLYCMKFKHEKNTVKLNLFKALKLIPARDLFVFGTFEVLNVVKFLFPIYVVLYVKDNYQAVGLVAVMTDLAIIVFTYFFGKRLDTSSKDFLRLSTLLVVVVFVVKAFSGNPLLYIVSFIEGFTTKMHEVSVQRKFYLLSKKYEYNNYNLAYEMALNFQRLFVATLIFILPVGIREAILIALGLMFLAVFVDFKHPKMKDFDESVCIEE